MHMKITRQELSAVGKSGRLCEGLWGPSLSLIIQTAPATGSSGGWPRGGARLRDSQAVPKAEGFHLSGPVSANVVHFLGFKGEISVLRIHFGGGVTRVLTSVTFDLLHVCPVLGTNSALHDGVHGVLLHLVVQNSVTDAAVVGETRLTAAA